VKRRFGCKPQVAPHPVRDQCVQAGTFINGLSVRYFTRFADEVKARGVKAIWDYFPDSFGCAAMPYQPSRPDVLEMNLAEWLHRAINTANYSSNIRNKMDEVQTRFALDLVSSPKVKVMLVWLPSNDVVSEQTPHGQFGGARPTIARMDADLGQIVERFKIRHRFEKTYFILVSDHGHAGGHDVVNQRFDVKREVFHAHLQMNVVGAWHRFNYPGAPRGRLGAVSDSDGAVGIFLPLGSVDSGDLSIPNTYEQLAHYGLADGSQVNAVELFAEYSSTGHWPLKDTTKRPVDFAVAKVIDGCDTETAMGRQRAMAACVPVISKVSGDEFRPVRNELVRKVGGLLNMPEETVEVYMRQAVRTTSGPGPRAESGSRAPAMWDKVEREALQVLMHHPEVLFEQAYLDDEYFTDPSNKIIFAMLKEFPVCDEETLQAEFDSFVRGLLEQLEDEDLRGRITRLVVEEPPECSPGYEHKVFETLKLNFFKREKRRVEFEVSKVNPRLEPKKYEALCARLLEIQQVIREQFPFDDE